MPVTSALGSAIKARRTALGWTQEELAARISADGEYVRQSEISRIENGRIALPRRERLERLAVVLNMPLGELLARSGWAGAEEHFSTPASPAIDSKSPTDISDDVAQRTIRPATEPLVYPSRSRQPSSASRVGSRPYDPSAMTAFRRALATMREESIRLEHNRQMASAIQRHFRHATRDELGEPVTVHYSDSAVG